jgi:acetyl-CoA C-acetyltransferase
MAYKRAGLKPKDIDVAEVHDCFTIAEILAIEDLEFVKKGEGGKAISDKITTLDGRIPVNPSGGLKAKGHPIGATGVAQIAEIVLQLRGEADKRQVKDAKIGLTHNVGAGGASCVVNILEVI